MFMRGGIAKGQPITDEHKAKLLAGKQYATLKRAMQNEASGVKLSKAQKVALENAQNIEDLRADINPGVVRKAKRAQRVKKLPELVQEVVQEVVSRPKKAKITKKLSEAAKAAEEEARMDLVQRLIEIIPRLRSEVLQSIAFLSGAGAKAPKSRRGCVRCAKMGCPSCMCGGAVSDLPIGQEGFDGHIVRAGARVRRATPRRRVARGGAVSDLPIGQEGFVGSRQRVARGGAVSDLPIGQEGFVGSRQSVVRGGVVMRGSALGGVSLGGVALGGARKPARKAAPKAARKAAPKASRKAAPKAARKRMPRGGSLFDTAMSVVPYIAPLLL
jgi:hypothetical protein